MSEPAPRPRRASDEPAKKETSILKGCILPILVLVVAIGALLSTCGGDNKMTESRAATHARDICRDAVKKGLKAPSSAVFSEENTGAAQDTGATYEFDVTGLVEAENSFGGTVANNYTCHAVVNKETGDVTGRVTSMTQR